MVKILLDPSMYHPHLSVAEECFKAAELGYDAGDQGHPVPFSQSRNLIPWPE